MVWGIIFGRVCRSAKKRFGTILVRCPESLETRRMLAGDVQAGDANQDYYFDEADLIQAFQGGKFNSNDIASWGEGDWSGDGRFSTDDLIAAFQNGLYRLGAYDPDAGEPIHHLKRLDNGGDAAIELIYNPTTGDLTAKTVDPEDRITTLNLFSDSSLLNPVSSVGIFDVSLASDLFSLFPDGHQAIAYQSVLAPGLIERILRDDLWIDGSLHGGGSLGNVQLRVTSEPVAAEVIVPRQDDSNKEVRVRGSGSRVPEPLPVQDGEFLAGDTNLDFYFNEADLIQAMRAGKYETQIDATWNDGDWNGDGRFNSSDLVIAFRNGTYVNGAYDVKASEPVDELSPFSRIGEADLTVHYDFATGDLMLDSHRGPFDTFQIVSRSGLLNLMDSAGGLFDVSSASSLFLFQPLSGYTQVLFEQVLPAGLGISDLLTDLLIDGSMLGGGSLGNVRLESNEIPPSERPTRFVALEEANSILTYDPKTGSMVISGIAAALTTIEITSSSGIFIGTATNDYKQGEFDLANVQFFFRFDPRGQQRIELDGIAQPELSEQDLHDDLTMIGTLKGGGFVAMALSVEASADFLVGDANRDYFFDEADFVHAMKLGKYETGLEASWSEGNWNGDNLFNSNDVVAAFANRGVYTQGAYSPTDNDSRHELRPLTLSHSSELEVVYDPTNGDLTLRRNDDETMMALHLVSRTGVFTPTPAQGIFDVATARSIFVLASAGPIPVDFPGLLTTGLSAANLLDDLLVDGAKLGGGGLGKVSLRIESVAEVGGHVFHDLNGDQQLSPRERGLNSMQVRLESIDGQLHQQTTTFQYDLDLDGEIDPLHESGLYLLSVPAAGQYRVIVAAPDGWTSTDSGTAIDIDSGTHHEIDLGLTAEPENVFLPGDTNQDFYFDASDLIQAMRSGGIPREASSWSDGDFDGNSVFDQEDLNLAFVGGAYRPGSNEAYREVSHAPHHQRAQLGTDPNDAIRVIYMPATGDIAVFGDQNLTSFQLHSRAGFLSAVSVAEQFEFSSSQSFFRFSPIGFDLRGGLFFKATSGLTADLLINDLSYDGSRLDGQPIDSVSLVLLKHPGFELSCAEIRAFGVSPGDANLDGVFDSTDLTIVFQAGEYSDNVEGNSKWREGDWNCDGDFDTTDIILAFQHDTFVFEAKLLSDPWRVRHKATRWQATLVE